MHVLHFFGEWAAWRSSDAELAAVVEDLNRRGIAIGIEGGPLFPRGTCSENIEGFAGPGEVHVMVDRIARAGGRVTYVVLEHGFDALAALSAECSMSLAEGAADMAVYLDTVRRVFPEAEFSITETGNLDTEILGAYFNAFREATGEYPAHLMLDVPYGEPHWPLAARAIEDHARSLGIGFAIFYLGEEEDTNDQEWMDNLRDHIVEYEVVYGGRPDRPLFTSWHDHPKNLLPGTESSAFTHILNWYTRTRTSISADTSEVDGGLLVSGLLKDSSGAALGHETVEIRFRSAGGCCDPPEGVFAPGGIDVLEDFVVTGVVPDGATTADVGYRINEECACNGPVDLLVEEFNYSENGGPNPISNPDFVAGPAGWIRWGEAAQVVETGGLHVQAAYGQVASLNSEMFPVASGASFTMTYSARISPQSDGNGHFTLIFHGEDGPIRRFRKHIRPSRALAGHTVTDADGRFELVVETPAEPKLIEAWYDGTETHWPALAETGEAALN